MSTEKVSMAAAKSFTKDALNSFSVEKAPFPNPPDAFLKNVFSQKLCGVFASSKFEFIFKFDVLELIELVELEFEGFSIKKKIKKGLCQVVLKCTKGCGRSLKKLTQSQWVYPLFTSLIVVL